MKKQHFIELNSFTATHKNIFLVFIIVLFLCSNSIILAQTELPNHQGPNTSPQKPETSVAENNLDFEATSSEPTSSTTSKYDKDSLSKTCNIVFVRHSERPSGKQCLTKAGKQQAKEISDFLKTETSVNGAFGKTFDKILMSQSRRVRYTLEFYGKHLEAEGENLQKLVSSKEELLECCYDKSKTKHIDRVYKTARMIQELCQQKKQDGTPTNILVGGHGLHGMRLLNELLGVNANEDAFGTPNHAEPYTLAQTPDGKFKRVRSKERVQTYASQANQGSCDPEYAARDKKAGSSGTAVTVFPGPELPW